MTKSKDSLGLFAIVVSIAIVVTGFFTFIGRDEEISFNIFPQISHETPVAENTLVYEDDLEQTLLDADMLNAMAPAAGSVAKLPTNKEVEKEIFGF